MNKKFFLLIALGIGLITSFCLNADESRKSPPFNEALSAEEILQSKANLLFVSERYEEAFTEFKILSEQHPNDIVLKRYLGACLEHLLRYAEAISIFQNILIQNPNDLPSRQHLGTIYLRQGEIKKAKHEFLLLVNQNQEATFSDFAKSQLEIIERLLDAPTQTDSNSELASDEFLKTPAAQDFMNGKYEKAFLELKKLELSHPKSLLIKRYVGLSLAKLERFEEAIQTLQLALRSAPGHIPLRYSLAQTYLQNRDLTSAKREFEIVAREDKSETYRIRAERELIGIGRLESIISRTKPKKWTFGVSSGAEHNSNATSESRIPEFGAQAGQRAWKFFSTMNASYELLKKKNWSFKGIYNYYQAFHSHGLSQINVIVNSLGANATYLRLLGGKPFVFQAGHATSQTLVRDNYYATTFTEYVTAIYSPTERYRIILSDRFFFSTYALDGTNADVTSRDGVGNAISWNNNFYLNRNKTFYYLLGFDYQRDQTQGVNYIRNTGSVRTGFHFPIFMGCEGETTFRFKESGFPKYSPTGTFPERRREEEYNLEVGISKKLAEQWALNAAYRLTMTDSQYDLYTYTNQAIGFSISFNY